MRRAALVTVIILLLVGLVVFAGFRAPIATAARPYEGQVIRAVVNAEYVKYSLTLVEKDLYEKLGVKIETEVIPLDAFVSKTLLEFNSGSSPWDLVMFGRNPAGYDATRKRDGFKKWLADQFAKNVPYDQLVKNHTFLPSRVLADVTCTGRGRLPSTGLMLAVSRTHRAMASPSGAFGSVPQ